MSVGRHVEAIQLHPAANGLRSDCFIASGRKLLAGNVGLPLPHPFLEEGSNASPDLPGLFGPADWLPALNQITEGFNPLRRRCLRAPQVQYVNAPFRIDPNDNVDG